MQRIKQSQEDFLGLEDMHDLLKGEYKSRTDFELLLAEYISLIKCKDRVDFYIETHGKDPDIYKHQEELEKIIETYTDSIINLCMTSPRY